MKITNQLGLPAGLVSAVVNDPYQRGPADISVTQLVSPPRLMALLRRHGNELTEDASERLWAIDGQSVHAVLDRIDLTDHLLKYRMFATINGWIISGELDLLDVPHGILWDYKKTSLWTVKEGPKTEWVAQLNVLAWLVSRTTPFVVQQLKICALYRDWSLRRSRYERDYEDKPIKVVAVDLWPLDKTKRYIADRVLHHRAASQQETITYQCSDAERWYSGGSYAVTKKGAKRALRLLNSEREAREYCADNGLDVEHGKVVITKRESSFPRCESYCPVRSICDQPRELLKED